MAQKMLYRHHAEQETCQQAQARAKENWMLKDVYDGENYQRLKSEGFMSDSRDILLSLSSDGAQLRKAATGDGWFILLINYNLAPELRYKNDYMIVAGIIPGPKCPSVTLMSFFEPLIRELEKAQTEPGIRAYDSIRSEWFFFQVHLLHILGDMPGSDKMSGMFGHKGLYGCRFCRIRGVRYRDGTRFPHLPPSDDQSWTDLRPSDERIYSYKSNRLPMRNQAQHLRDCAAIEAEAIGSPAQKRARTASGVSVRSQFLRLKSIAYPWSLPLDVMHLFWSNHSLQMAEHFKVDIGQEAWASIEYIPPFSHTSDRR